MARIRTIKPEFFRHEGLQDLANEHGAHVMLVFAGLWGHCDKAGRFEWKPRTLKLDILPFMDFDMGDVLALLASAGMMEKYTVSGKTYGFIPSFDDHQRIGGKEAQEPSKHPEAPVKQRGSNGEAPVKHLGLQEGKGREEEGNGVEAREEILASPKPIPSKSSSTPKGTRWPSEAVVSEDWLIEGEAYRGTAGHPHIDLRAEALKFANYWASKSGGSATKIDWKRTWLNWCLQARGSSNVARFGAKSQLEQLAEIVAGERAGTIIDG